MRNPLKKLQKKINVRLATKAAQHSQPLPTKGSPDHKKPQGSDSHRSLSVTSTGISASQEEDDPLFNNRSSRMRRALADSRKGNESNQQQLQQAATTPVASPKKKKKGGRRISFGGNRKVKGEQSNQEQQQVPPSQLPLSTNNEEEEISTKRTEPAQNKAATAVITSPARRQSFLSSPKKSPRTPPKSSIFRLSSSKSTSNSSSPISPSSNSHIPAPPSMSTSRFNSPTKSSKLKNRDKAETAPYEAATAKGTASLPKFLSDAPPKVPPGLKQLGTKTTESDFEVLKQRREQAKQRASVIDPAMDRIAKAAAALDNTGNEMFEKGDYDKAMMHYIKALKLKNRSLGTTEQPADEVTMAGHLKSVSLEHKMAAKDHTSNSNKLPSAMKKEQQQQPAQPQPPKMPDHPPADGADDLWISVATSINNIAYLNQQSGKASADETMQAYQNSLQIKQRVLGKDSLSVGKTLNNLGTVHYLKREYEPALQAYREALQIMMASLGSFHLDVGTVHSNIGDVYWAQSGDANAAEGQKCSEEEFFLASRNSALRHYRHSLEIRWEQLKDHHDHKIIRLLEKIAALEMGESFLALVQSSHKHRQSPKAASAASTPTKNAADEECSSPQVQQELQTLHAEVRNEVKTMDMMERKMAIDMVKDKLRLIREMKKLSSLNICGSFDDDESWFGDDDNLTPSKVTPLSPVQRADALSAVKERLELLRGSRTKGDAAAMPVNDLKEADASPTNYFLSHRASEILSRHLQTPTSTKMNDLDELRKFSFNEVVENDPVVDCKEEGEATATKFDVGLRASSALGEGIDALRSLSVNQGNQYPTTTMQSNPWTISTSTTMAPLQEKSVCSPTTPLAAASMGAF